MVLILAFNKTVKATGQRRSLASHQTPSLATLPLVTAKLLQSCPTLCDPIDSSLQAPLSLGFSRQKYWSGWPFPSPMHVCMLNHFSHVSFCATPWTAAHQAPLSTEFSRQGYWSGLPFPTQGDLPDPGIEPGSPSLRPDSLPSEPPGKPTIP